MRNRIMDVVKSSLAPIAVAVFVSGTPANAAGPDDVLVVPTYGGSLERIFKNIYKPFEAKSGVTIQWVSGNSAGNSARALAAKEHPEYDIVLSDPVAYLGASQQGAFAQVDTKALPNFKDVYEQSLLPAKDGLIVGFLYTGLFYRPAEFTKNGWAADSWSDLLRPEFCHHLGLNDLSIAFGLDTLIMLSGGKPENIETGIKRIASLKDCVAVLEPTAAQMEQKILAGEYLVGSNGSVRVGPLIRQGAPIRFIVPKEGMVGGGGAVMAPTKNPPHPKHVSDFLNWMLERQSQEKLMQEAFYGPVNRKVTVPADLVELGVPDEARLKRMIPVDANYIQSHRRQWTREVSEAFSR